MNQINKISALASKLLSKIGIDGMAYSLPELGYVVIKVFWSCATMGSNHYNRSDLRPEGSVRQVLQENRVLN